MTRASRSWRRMRSMGLSGGVVEVSEFISVSSVRDGERERCRSGLAGCWLPSIAHTLHLSVFPSFRRNVAVLLQRRF